MQQASGRKFKGIRRRVGSAFPDAHAWSSRRVTPVRLPPVQPSPEPMTRFLIQRPRRCRVTKYRSLHKFQHQRTAQYVDRKSTRLNSSHLVISYAVFCLKKKKKKNISRNFHTETNRLKI